MLDSSGTRVSGGTLTGVTAAGQPGGVATSEGGTITHYGGFLGCITLLPGLDTDGDGLADEIDADNDDDGLTDLAETGGGAFTPTTITYINDADSDDDGASDGDESVAMTNPLDDTSLLELLSISSTPIIGVEWAARGGLTYNVLAVDDVTALGGAVVISNVTATGGSAPWFETTAAADDAGAPAHRAYVIEVAP